MKPPPPLPKKRSVFTAPLPDCVPSPSTTTAPERFVDRDLSAPKCQRESSTPDCVIDDGPTHERETTTPPVQAPVVTSSTPSLSGSQHRDDDDDGDTPLKELPQPSPEGHQRRKRTRVRDAPFRIRSQPTRIQRANDPIVIQLGEGRTVRTTGYTKIRFTSPLRLLLLIYYEFTNATS